MLGLGLLVLGLHVDWVPRVLPLLLHAGIGDAVGHAGVGDASPVPVLPNRHVPDP